LQGGDALAAHGLVPGAEDQALGGRAVGGQALDGQVGARTVVLQQRGLGAPHRGQQGTWPWASKYRPMLRLTLFGRGSAWKPSISDRMGSPGKAGTWDSRSDWREVMELVFLQKWICVAIVVCRVRCSKKK
jgi:hypothetical protein